MSAKNTLVIPANDRTLSFTGELTMSDIIITRIINGEEIKIVLTYKELDDAYSCREHIHHYDDVINNIEEMECDDELNGHRADEITGNYELVETIISTYEHNMDKHEMDWYEAVRDAIKEEIGNAEKSGLLPSEAPDQAKQE